MKEGFVWFLAKVEECIAAMVDMVVNGTSWLVYNLDDVAVILGHNVLAYYIAVLLADMTRHWARWKLLKRREFPRMPIHLLRLADRTIVEAEFGEDIGYDILTITALGELSHEVLPTLFDSIRGWVEKGELLVNIPPEHRSLVYDRLVSRVSEALASCPIEGKFMLFLVNEEEADTKAIRIILIEESILMRFLHDSDRPVTSEYRRSYYRIGTLRYLARKIFDADGTLPMVDGKSRRDRECFAWVADTNKGARRPVAFYKS